MIHIRSNSCGGGVGVRKFFKMTWCHMWTASNLFCRLDYSFLRSIWSRNEFSRNVFGFGNTKLNFLVKIFNEFFTHLVGKARMSAFGHIIYDKKRNHIKAIFFKWFSDWVPYHQKKCLTLPLHQKNNFFKIFRVG